MRILHDPVYQLYLILANYNIQSTEQQQAKGLTRYNKGSYLAHIYINHGTLDIAGWTSYCRSIKKQPGRWAIEQMLEKTEQDSII